MNADLIRSDEKPSNETDILGNSFPRINFFRMYFYGILSTIFWVIIIDFNDTAGRWLGVAFLGVLLMRSLMVMHRNPIESFSIVFYLAMIQPALRTYLVIIPYLALEYFFVFWGLLYVYSLRRKRFYAPAIFYFLYLLLEIIGVFSALDLQRWRSVVLASATLWIALLLINQFPLRKKQTVKIASYGLLGAINLSGIILYRYMNSTVTWGTESNFAASGDMGPVQVSMLLAVAVILLGLFVDRARIAQRPVLISMIGGFFIIMVLTFSRTGLYLVVIALFSYYFLFSKVSGRTLLLGLAISALGLYFFNFAVGIAGQNLIERFSDTTPTNRIALVEQAWKMFLDFPAFGVGTSNYFRVVARAEYFGSVSGTHNELLRAMAEHGILGLVTWGLFAISTTWMIYTTSYGKVRAFRMAILLLFFAYLSVNGLKLLAQPLLLVLAFSTNDI